MKIISAVGQDLVVLVEDQAKIISAVGADIQVRAAKSEDLVKMVKWVIVDIPDFLELVASVECLAKIISVVGAAFLEPVVIREKLDPEV